MTLSRSGPWLLLAACSASPAQAQVAIDYRLPPPPERPSRLDVRPDCALSESEGEIVVCGSREDERYRVAPSPRPRRAADRAGGEQMQALADGTPSHCSPVGRDQQCNGGLDILGIAFTIARAIARARANRD